MTHVTWRLTAKNWDQLQNHTLSNRVCAAFYLPSVHKWNEPSCLYSLAAEHLHTVAVTPFLSVHFSGLSCPGWLVKYQGGLPSMWAPGRNAPLIRFWILARYILLACLYRTLPHLSFFLHVFLTYLLHYLTFRLRIDPFHFQAGYLKRRLNLALVLLFCIVVHFFLIGECMLLWCWV